VHLGDISVQHTYIFSSRPVSRQIFSETDETRQSGGKLEKPRLVASLSQGGHVNHRTYADAIFVVREEVSREIKPRLCAEITSRSPEKALPLCAERSSSRGARLCTQGTGRELQRVTASHALVQHIDIGSAVKLTIAHPAAIKGARATAGCARKTRRRDMRLLADDARHARFTHIATSLYSYPSYAVCSGGGDALVYWEWGDDESIAKEHLLNSLKPGQQATVRTAAGEHWIVRDATTGVVIGETTTDDTPEQRMETGEPKPMGKRELAATKAEGVPIAGMPYARRRPEAHRY